MTIGELRELSQAAALGPWIVHKYYSPTGYSRPDIELIVAMRNHIDALLDVAEAAQELGDDMWGVPPQDKHDSELNRAERLFRDALARLEAQG